MFLSKFRSLSFCFFSVGIIFQPIEALNVSHLFSKLPSWAQSKKSFAKVTACACAVGGLGYAWYSCEKGITSIDLDGHWYDMSCFSGRITHANCLWPSAVPVEVVSNTTYNIAERTHSFIVRSEQKNLFVIYFDTNGACFARICKDRKVLDGRIITVPVQLRKALHNQLQTVSTAHVNPVCNGRVALGSGKMIDFSCLNLQLPQSMIRGPERSQGAFINNQILLTIEKNQKYALSNGKVSGYLVSAGDLDLLCFDTLLDVQPIKPDSALVCYNCINNRCTELNKVLFAQSFAADDKEENRLRMALIEVVSSIGLHD